MKNQIIISFFLLVAFSVVPVFAQEKSKDKIIAEYTKLKKQIFSSDENQCKMYGKANFSGNLINLKIVDADIRDILKEITKQIGIEFEVDKSVGRIPVTTTFYNTSWNIGLNSLLESVGLEAQNQCPVLRIVKTENPIIEKRIRGIGLDKSELYTEIIKLKNLKLKEITESDNSSLEENTKKFVKIFTQFLTRRGAIEIDSRNNSVIITDLKDGTELISNFVKLLDDSGFTLVELSNESVFNLK